MHKSILNELKNIKANPTNSPQGIAASDSASNTIKNDLQDIDRLRQDIISEITNLKSSIETDKESPEGVAAQNAMSSRIYELDETIRGLREGLAGIKEELRSSGSSNTILKDSTEELTQKVNQLALEISNLNKS